MKKLSILSIFVFILFSLTKPANAAIVEYNPHILNLDKEHWIKHFNFYNKAYVTKVTENEVSLDLGEYHKIELGMIYDIYSINTEMPVAKICITQIDKYSASGIFLNKPKSVDSIMLKAEARFTNLIDTGKNLSYLNRIELTLNGKITLLEKDLCFINIKKSQGINKGQIFLVFNEKNKKIGELEIIEIIEGDSIAVIKKQDEPFKIGNLVKKENRNINEWLDLADEWTKNVNTDDSIYAYNKAIELGAPQSEIFLKMETIITSCTQKYEQEGKIDKAIYYWNICKKNTKNCEENYDFLSKKALEQAKAYWEKKEWLEVIKIIENLPNNEDAKKYLSGSYNFLGKEFEKKNKELSIYCYEQSFNASSTNIFTLKNLINIYFQDLQFDKSLFWLKKFKQVAIREEDKNWADLKLDEMSRVQEGKPPACSFTSYYGKNFILDSFLGNIVVLVLWDTNDPVSRSEIDFLNFFYDNNKYKGKKIKIIAVHDKIDTDAVKQYIQANDKLNLEIVFANDNNKFLFPEKNIFPQNAVLDKKGKIVYQKTGFNESEFKDLIDGLLLE